MSARTWVSAVLAIVGLTGTAGAYTFDEVAVDAWVGSGDNRALLVVDWQEARTLVLGYRWDGSATAVQMVNALHDANVGFYRKWHPEYVNKSIFGMGWDVDGDGGSFVPGFPENEIGYATDPDDYYAEGWMNNGYWAYFTSSNGVDWSYDGAGLEHTLTDGEWNGFSWAAAPSWDGGVPDNIPLLPEPATALLAAGALGVVVGRRPRRP